MLKLKHGLTTFDLLRIVEMGCAKLKIRHYISKHPQQLADFYNTKKFASTLVPDAW